MPRILLSSHNVGASQPGRAVSQPKLNPVTGFRGELPLIPKYRGHTRLRKSVCRDERCRVGKRLRSNEALGIGIGHVGADLAVPRCSLFPNRGQRFVLGSRIESIVCERIREFLTSVKVQISNSVEEAC